MFNDKKKTSKTIGNSITPKNRGEIIAEAAENLKSMKLALIHEISDAARSEQVGERSDCMDSGDLASEDYEHEMSLMLSQRGRNRISEIDDALRRIGKANYGVCENCGLKITTQRLEAMPFTRHCCDCQQDEERAAKTRHHGGDIEQARFDEFGSTSSEDDINRESIRRARDENNN